MKTLVVYYSRGGHTKKVATEIARALTADLEEIQEIKSRDGVIGWLNAGRDATLKKLTDIEPATFDPADYDLVIIGTPIWAYTMASGIRTWLTSYGTKLNQVAFFATMGGSGDKRAFKHMEELSGKPPKATATFIDKLITQGTHESQLEIFINQLNCL